jgi:hypothetical protein
MISRWSCGENSGSNSPFRLLIWERNLLKRFPKEIEKRQERANEKGAVSKNERENERQIVKMRERERRKREYGKR